MGNWIPVWSSFIFARPSAIEGAARTLDLGGTFQEYNYSTSAQEADAKALYADWRAIGDDLVKVTKEISEQTQVQISDELLQQARDILQSAVQKHSPALAED